ncbi:MAG: hypothetical protein GY841_07330 [FCB group bacterium]|nr:hypothetical protein [FCB group bacterium]
MMTTTFGLDFIQRTLRTTGVLLLLCLVIGSVYFSFYDALAVLSAGIWSMVNLIFLSAVVRSAMRPDGVDKMTVVVLMLIKFPLLYAAAYFLFTVEIFRPLPLVIGLSTVLVVMFLKAASRALLKLDVNNHEGSSRGLA